MRVRGSCGELTRRVWQGICATVIKKVCRQLGIEKWPFKGNKITLRKQGICHGRKKAERAEAAVGDAGGEEDSAEVSGHIPAARHAASMAYHSPGPHAHHVIPDHGRAQMPKPQALRHMGHLSASAYGQTHVGAAERKPMRALMRGLDEGGPARRGQGNLDLCMPQGLLGAGAAMPGSGATALHPTPLQGALVERSLQDWRMSNAGGGPGGGVFGWEARAVLPGMHDARHTAQHMLAPRPLTRCISPAGDAGHELAVSGRDMEGQREGKYSPSSEQSDSKKDMSMVLEDDDHGFDLSWLVPSDPPQSRIPLHDMRGLQDIDADMLERFRGPLQYASEN